MREAARACRDGFMGKLAIHPSQIGPINAAFSPQPEEIARAQAIIAAFAAAPQAGVLSLNGQMLGPAPSSSGAAHPRARSACAARPVKLRMKGDSLRPAPDARGGAAIGGSGRPVRGARAHQPARRARLTGCNARPQPRHTRRDGSRDGVIEIQVPEAVARDCVPSELVTLDGRAAPRRRLICASSWRRIFPCLAPRTEEDESDNFPHPNDRSPCA